MKKYIKVMADYYSTGLWNSRGTSVDPKQIPIPFWLTEELDDWCLRYDLTGMSCDFDVDSFNRVGYSIAVKIKQALPDWKVLYFDEVSHLTEKNVINCIKEIN